MFIHNAYCDVASDYHKKKNVLRLKSADNAESLLEAASASDMKEWIAKVNYYAGIKTCMDVFISWIYLATHTIYRQCTVFEV